MELHGNSKACSRMRILMHGAEAGDDLASCLARGLADEDCERYGIEFPALDAGLWSRAARILVPGVAFRKDNACLVARVDEVRPDVFWLFKGMEIYPRTLRTLRERGITLVNYNADHPFEHFSRGSGNRNVSRSIPQFHLHLTYSERIARSLRERYPSVRVAVVAFGHDIEDSLYKRISGEEEIARVCFLGNPDTNRARWINQVVAGGIPVDVFGYRWDRFLKPTPLLRLNGQANGLDMLRTLRRYRVQLNFFRPHNADSHNMRTFEVPACGGIMLAEDSTEHRAFFEHGREAFFFKSSRDLIEICRMLLTMPREEADAIRAAARSRCVRSGYSYRHRAHAALKEITAVHAERHLDRPRAR